jgi:hypothetical protein
MTMIPGPAVVIVTSGTDWCVFVFTPGRLTNIPSPCVCMDSVIMRQWDTAGVRDKMRLCYIINTTHVEWNSDMRSLYYTRNNAQTCCHAIMSVCTQTQHTWRNDYCPKQFTAHGNELVLNEIGGLFFFFLPQDNYCIKKFQFRRQKHSNIDLGLHIAFVLNLRFSFLLCRNKNRLNVAILAECGALQDTMYTNYCKYVHEHWVVCYL